MQKKIVIPKAHIESLPLSAEAKQLFITLLDAYNISLKRPAVDPKPAELDIHIDPTILMELAEFGEVSITTEDLKEVLNPTYKLGNKTLQYIGGCIFCKALRLLEGKVYLTETPRALTI